jgi:hypothetical protein
VDWILKCEGYVPRQGGRSSAVATAVDLSSNPDREQKWFSIDGSKRLVRLVDLVSAQGRLVLGDLHGLEILMEGESYLSTRRKKRLQVHHVFGNVDHDGDRYGFVRNMKSSQDSFNFKHSKR